MTYYVYRTWHDDYAYAIGAFRPDGSIVSGGELASFRHADHAVSFARGLADPTDSVMILPSVETPAYA